MRHDTCYRDNETGKPECDRKMLAELNVLTPLGRREKVDRQLVRGIIGLKHRLGMGIWCSQLAEELHKPVRNGFKNATCLLNKSTTCGLLIWSTCHHTRDQTVVTNTFSQRLMYSASMGELYVENQNW